MQSADSQYSQSFTEEEGTYCPICYHNVLVPDNKPIPEGDLGTVEFECKHRFCGECTVEYLKANIEKAEIEKLKCCDFECKTVISEQKIGEILKARGLTELFEKY